MEIDTETESFSKAMIWGLIAYLWISFIAIILYLSLQLPWTSVVLGFSLAALPLPLFLGLVLFLDKTEPEPWGFLLIAFVWGATLAAIISLIFNSFFGVLTARYDYVLTSSVSAPVVEELSKAAVLYYLFFFKRKNFNGVSDGIIYAFVVALGFAMTENIFYYARSFSTGGLSEGLATFGLRGLITPYAHPLFTACTGLGLGLAVAYKQFMVRWNAPFFGLCAAIILHSMWNTSSTLGIGMFMLAYVLVFLPLFIMVSIVAYKHSRRQT